ncbi:unnamed protein product [Nippostrongylus brasiliensis]|uniref:Pecanex-like protein n=1 Tax=Nippostrongylus brasiliensis TaxID=27835 RepID=A0A0N4YPE9_NIPBR|nr:unnamed protein product [Nippostrongylus brasiliensis]
MDHADLILTMSFLFKISKIDESYDEAALAAASTAAGRVLANISGRNSWHVQPTTGQKGRVMYTWHPNHPNRKMRSHIGDAIHLVAIPEMGCTLVPVSEKGCTLLTEEREPTDYRSVGNTKQYLSFISKVKKDLYNWTMCGMTPYMTRPINTSS